MTRDASGRTNATMGALAIVAAWATYLPLGLQYLCYLSWGLLAMLVLHRAKCWPRLLRSPLFWLPLTLCLLLAISTGWSSAPPTDRLSHLWHYGRVLLVPVIASACPPDAARRGLRHFVLASALVGALTVLDAIHALPASPLLASSIGSSGNQRIATSLLLSLGVAIALVQAADTAQPRARRFARLVAAVLVAVGLSLQDRRTGLVALPVLLAALAISRQRSWWRSGLMLGGVALLATMTWLISDGVRGRFDEGLAELRSYRSTGVVDSSWGMRMRMAELTFEMVREKPLLGHGVASWLGHWRARAQGGGELLLQQRTPHNEYLLIASQVGAVGTALWIAVLAVYLAQAWRAGRAGDASLLVWTAIAWSALFNVVIRDAKFALPLLLLAALALAASRPQRAVYRG